MKTGNTFFAMAVIAILGITTISCGNDDTHTHAYSAAWQTNETQHWKECSCGEKNETANHTFNGNGVCNVCEYEQQPKDQSEIISLFGDTHSATVKGYFTDTEWGHDRTDGIAGRIAIKLNNSFDSEKTEEDKDLYREIFNRGVTYIVEAIPEDYTKYKTIGDGKTIYIALDKIDTAVVTDGVRSIYTYASKIN